MPRADSPKRIRNPKRMREFLRRNGFLLVILVIVCTFFVGSLFNRIEQMIIICLIEIVLAIVAWQVNLLQEQFEELGTRIATIDEKIPEVNDLVNQVYTIREQTSQDSLRQIMQHLATLSEHSSIFFRTASSELARTADALGDMASGRTFNKYTRPTGRDLTDTFAIYIDALKRGDRWNTVSNLLLWSKEILEDPSHFLRVNVDAAHRGVTIRRTFILRNSLEEQDIEELELLRKHRELTLGLKNFETRIVTLQKDYEDVIRTGGNFAVWEYRNTETAEGEGAGDRHSEQVALIMHYKKEEHGTYEFDRLQISADPSAVRSKSLQFTEFWEQHQGLDLKSPEIGNRLADALASKRA